MIRSQRLLPAIGILLIILSCLVPLVISTFSPSRYYVDVKASCGFNCDGESDSPFPNLRRAIKAIQSAQLRSPFQDDDFELWVAPGMYLGGENIEMSVNARSISISSTHGSSRTIIDCLGEGRFLTITNASVSLSGFTIRNCYHTEKGGAVLSLASSISLEDVIFENNTASQGGAMFGSVGSFKFVSCRFENNKALDDGGALYLSKMSVDLKNTIISCNNLQSKSDIYCKSNSSGAIDFASSVSLASFACESRPSCSFVLDYSVQLCGQNSTCSQRQSPVIIDDNNSTYGVDPDADQISIPDAKNYATCGDGKCEVQYESCLSCPSDCNTCKFTGVKLESYTCSPMQLNNSDCLYKVTSRQSPDVRFFMKEISAPVSGIMTGYFAVPKSGRYFFKVRGANVGAKVTVDNNILTDAMFQQDQVVSQGSVYLEETGAHVLSVIFFSFSNSIRNLSVVWSDNGEQFSEMTDLSLLTIDNGNKTSTAAPYCGDGICQENFPSSCFIDCYAMFSHECSLQAPPPGKISDTGILVNDTLGSLLQNQYLPRLPGVEHLMNGFDIVYGAEVVSPLFYFGFCTTDDLSVVQNPHRSSMYVVPSELFAQAHSVCNYNISTSEFSSAAELATSMAESTAYSVKASAGGGIPALFEINVGAAYSQETSVQTAMEMETKRTGSILKTEVYCLTSKVQMNKITFHPAFLKDLSLVDSVEEMLPLVKKYGTHYYRSASLGGKLTQITTVESEFTRSKTSSELSQHAQLSFHASVSSPVFSVKGSFDYSKDTDLTSEQQDSFESSSSRSKILTYGGAPGSFGPSSSFDTPTSYGEWAATIDLLPVPVQYELDYVFNALPTAWKTKSGHALRDLWSNATLLYYQQSPKYIRGERETEYDLFFSFDYDSTDHQLFETPHAFHILLHNANTNTTYDIPLIDNDMAEGGSTYAPFSLQGYAPNSAMPNPVKLRFVGPDMKQIDINNRLVGFYVVPQSLTTKISPFLRLWNLGDSSELLISTSDAPVAYYNGLKLFKHTQETETQIHFVVKNVDIFPPWTSFHPGKALSFMVEFQLLGTMKTKSVWRNLRDYWPEDYKQEIAIFSSLGAAELDDIGELVELRLRIGGPRRYVATPWPHYIMNYDYVRKVNDTYKLSGESEGKNWQMLRKQLLLWSDDHLEDCYFNNLAIPSYERPNIFPNPKFEVSKLHISQQSSRGSKVYKPFSDATISLELFDRISASVPLVPIQFTY